MTCFFLDTEFIDDGRTIDLISIALVSEDGQMLYCCNTACDLTRADPWVRENVVTRLPDATSELWLHPHAIRETVEAFVRGYEKPYHFWAYYADYDWVAFCQLWGRMLDLPEDFPKYCRDLKQEMDRMGYTKSHFPRNRNEHDALADALWNRQVWRQMRADGL